MCLVRGLGSSGYWVLLGYSLCGNWGFLILGLFLFRFLNVRSVCVYRKRVCVYVVVCKRRSFGRDSSKGRFFVNVGFWIFLVGDFLVFIFWKEGKIIRGSFFEDIVGEMGWVLVRSRFFDRYRVGCVLEVLFFF